MMKRRRGRAGTRLVTIPTLDAAAVTVGARVGWPSIVEYELTEGPNAGERLPVPPTFASDPHPAPDELGSRGRCVTRPSCAYRLVIHDYRAYEALARTGRLYGPPHTTAPEPVVDNRKTS
ncbi:MAG: hypothetical protein AB7N54_19870 [Alphaproteobacteria bacterium]